MSSMYEDQWSGLQEQIYDTKERLRALTRLAKSLRVVMDLEKGCDCTVVLTSEEAANAQL